MIKHLNIKIYGKVQGIFYRVTAKEQARKLNIFGFARNENGESVYIEAEGEEGNLDKFVAWCKVGPPLARVDNVEITQGQIKNFSDFDTY